MLRKCGVSAAAHLYRRSIQKNLYIGREESLYSIFSCRSHSNVAAAAAVHPTTHSHETSSSTKTEVNLNKMFWAKPCSLALSSDSPFRVDDPKYEGFKHTVMKLLLFYSKQSRSIRGANVVYQRIISQIDKPAIYDVFSLEKNFKTTFSLLILHMWFCLHRFKQEGKEGVEFGQYLYEIYNHDVELRVSKAGVNLLLITWMKDLEKIFYGNIVAYDKAIAPEAKQDELQIVLWRNIFSDDGSSKPSGAGLLAVQAMSRYVRMESTCMSLTDKEALFSGNFQFTSLKNLKPDTEGLQK
ncbi:ubiquinol-cytochrome-c reductase complex assembly factor 1 [Impatiens glandulifera]|uniref:ubiquinol-cytochrome-c reductase complex assembly factor 1 n=1 Tax=Impatiens glandulifera TaxID=253017 RepID=UPI001FB0E3CE|nr:ubiquinol-cytochrome-c reductase complex assembly factor 1 [Impatiens glandulifera]